MSVAALGALVMVLAFAVVQDTPHGRVVATETMTARATLDSVKTVWLRPGTRLGFFTHMGTQFSVTVFALMWGVPYLIVAQGQVHGGRGRMLTVSVVAAIAAGIVIGIFTGRFPHRRSGWCWHHRQQRVVWTVVLALPERAPLWLLVVLIVVISVGGPDRWWASTSRAPSTRAPPWAPPRAWSTWAVPGLAAGHAGDGRDPRCRGGYSFDSFRLAWTVQYAVWVSPSSAS